ncbi:hypothetical protein CIB48_g3796 [Xylaria polymorpha]|nr:hypothetical protein CIB48_g3796 [Xylaria polymorpha]
MFLTIARILYEGLAVDAVDPARHPPPNDALTTPPSRATVEQPSFPHLQSHVPCTLGTLGTLDTLDTLDTLPTSDACASRSRKHVETYPCL